MTESSAPALERALVLAPTGRDAELTCILLARAGIDCRACADMNELCGIVEHDGAALILLAEEVLVPAAVRRLTDMLTHQPAWSDLPILLFTGENAKVQARSPTARLLAPLGNVTLLDRPVRPITVISAAQSALRARHRQYMARDELTRRRQEVEQRDRFLAMLGHELRNPLSAILMAIEVMERGGDGAAPRAIIGRQAVHLGRLVDDLLDVARVTSGKIVLQRAPLALDDLVQRSVATAAAQAGRREITLRAPAEPVCVEGDVVRLEQVVANLIANAVKYTPDGGRIEVSVAREGGDAVVRVADDGVGIAPDMLSRVFEMFVQAQSTIDRSQGGMGIGLTLVKNLVELHGGRVEARSDGPGRGSEFTFRLPAQPQRSRPDSGNGHATHRTTGHVHDILVVEDNTDSRELLATIVGASGHRVTTASDGLMGVERALQQPPSVMIVDIGLPGLDGYEVARRVRAALGDQVYLIALTGYGQPSDRGLALDAGFDLHLTKPVDIDRLRDILDRRDPRTRERPPAPVR